MIAGPRIDMSPYPGVSGGIALGIPYIAWYMVGTIPIVGIVLQLEPSSRAGHLNGFRRKQWTVPLRY